MCIRDRFSTVNLLLLYNNKLSSQIVKQGKCLSVTDSQVESNYRSALQESALVVSLQMFNLILERCIQLLKQDEVERQKNETNVKTTINTDIQYLLPAIKVSRLLFEFFCCLLLLLVTISIIFEICL